MESFLDKQEFIGACGDGGPRLQRALVRLYRASFAPLYRDCVRTIRCADSAQELVHRTLINAWQCCRTFKGQSELLPWLRAILHRLILDTLRAAKPATPLEDANGEIAAEVEAKLGEQTPAVTPEQAVHDRDAAACFARCRARFAREAPEHAAVIMWIAEEGLSNDEIAERLDRSPGATRVFIHQCRVKARYYFAEWYRLQREQR